MQTNAINTLIDTWLSRGTAVILTGAGASTDSGVYDFAGNGGEYGSASVKRILSREFLFENPEIFHKYCHDRLFSPHTAPNSFHKLLARLETTGLVSGIITQNIDLLHQKAGSKKVVELHGNMETVYCDNCKSEGSSKFLYYAGRSFKCPHCGGFIRPNILLYGEPINSSVYKSALLLAESAPLLIVAGTRLKVTAPIDIINHFKGATNGYTVYIGDTLPDYRDFDLFVLGNLSEIAAELEKKLS